MSSLPRMRTIPEALADLKEQDPHTALTVHALRRMIKAGEIPHINAGQKVLINMDTLVEHLSNPKLPSHDRERGKIRPIPERRA